MAEHVALPAGQRHPVHNYEYADEAAMNSASGFTSADIGKVAFAQSEGTFHILTDVSPTWIPLGGGGGGGGGNEHVAEDAETDVISAAVTLKHNSTGTPAAGFGTGVAVQADTDTTPDTPIGHMAWKWKNAAHDYRNAAVVVATEHYSGYHHEAIYHAGAMYWADPPVPGNERGGGAVDIQGSRNEAAAVASGAHSTIIGGYNNTASAYYAVAIGGERNVASAYHAVALGWGTVADKHGQIAQGSFKFANGFDDISQGTIQIMVGRQFAHSTSSWFELFTNGNQNAGKLTIPQDTLWVFEVLLAGVETSGGGELLAYHIRGAIMNEAGTTTLLASTVAEIHESTPGFDARVSADDTNDALLIEVTDGAGNGDNMRWVGQVRMVEVQR